MTLNITPISSNSANKTNCKQPSFNGTVEYGAIIDGITKDGQEIFSKKAYAFNKKIEKLSDKIVDIDYNGKLVNTTVEKGEKKNTFIVKSQLEGSDAYGEAVFKLSNLFGGKTNARRLVSKIKESVNNIKYHITELKNKADDISIEIRKKANEAYLDD